MSEIDFEKIESTIRNATDGLERVLNSLSESGTRLKDAASRMPDSYLKNNPRRVIPKLYKDVSSEETKNTVQMILGGGLAAAGVIFGISTIGMLISAVPLFSVLGTGFLAGLLLAGGLPAFFKGLKKKKLGERFKTIVGLLGNKTVMSIEELSEKLDVNVKKLLEELKELIRLRYFTQGHLDDDEKELITSDDTYKNYRMLLETHREAEAARKEEQDTQDTGGFTPEGLEILRQGEQYLSRIEAMNAELPGIVITAKLQRLESVIRSILYEVKRQPDSATDLRKLMNYYLPTVWKLLETYKEINDEPVITEQMARTQQEIEGTIDTINGAFENLLEQLFRNKAWDVSSDISVLNTMLAQDGIKDSAFSMNAKKEEVRNE